MKPHLVLHGILAVAVSLVFLAGCRKADDPGNYQEYSALKNTGEASLAAKNSAADMVSNKETPPPAVAEKPDQPAIAQASYERVSAKNTEAVTANVAQGNPRDLKLAKPAGPPREIKLLVPEKSFPRADKEGTFRVSYDDIDLLKILNMEPVPLNVIDYLPEWLQELDGKRIRIRGFMMAYQEEDIRGFTLARDNEICCFGRDPKVYDLVEIRMREGTTTNYLPNRPFDVEGTFHIVSPEPDEKVLFRLYEIRDAAVITGRSR
jgi:hypothetical protein